MLSLRQRRTQTPATALVHSQAAIAALQQYPGGMHLGGGVNPTNAAAYLDAGASHVIVTSYVFRDGELDEGRLGELERAVGKQRLVLDLSCRKRDGQYYVVTDRWQRFSSLRCATADSMCNGPCTALTSSLHLLHLLIGWSTK